MPIAAVPARRPLVRLGLVLLLAGVCGQAVGCHNLQEHRRARWNYTPGMSAGSDPYSAIWCEERVEGVA